MNNDEFGIVIFVRPNDRNLRDELKETATDIMGAIRAFETGRSWYVDASVSAFEATKDLVNIGTSDAKIFVSHNGPVPTQKTKQSRNRFVRELLAKTFPGRKIEIHFNYEAFFDTAESFIHDQVEPTKKALIEHTVEQMIFRKIIATLDHQLFDALDEEARQRLGKLVSSRADASAEKILSWARPSVKSPV